VLVLAGGRLRRDTTPDALRAELATAVVSFRPARTDVARGWAEVRVRRVTGDRTELLTTDPDALVRHLVHARIHFADLQVRPAHLEDAFLAIVEPET
jgi:ABC-2 type transport system ATP-binding protein